MGKADGPYRHAPTLLPNLHLFLAPLLHVHRKIEQLGVVEVPAKQGLSIIPLMQQKHHLQTERSGESSLRRIKYQMCDPAEDLASMQAEVDIYIKFFARQGLKCTFSDQKRGAKRGAKCVLAWLDSTLVPWRLAPKFVDEAPKFVDDAHCSLFSPTIFFVDGMVARITLVRLARLCLNTALKCRCPICYAPLHFDENLGQHFAAQHSQAPVPAVVRLHNFICR